MEGFAPKIRGKNCFPQPRPTWGDGGGGGRSGEQGEGLTFRFRFFIRHCWLLKEQ